MIEIEGNLITLAQAGEFDVICHGANCFCTMKRGLAPQMASAFDCANYPMEAPKYRGDINKLGTIDYKAVPITENRSIYVINAYTQYHWDTATKPLDYEALRLCLKKINHIFQGLRIGLPEIGCHLAGGDWNIVKGMIEQELKDMEITVVHFKP